MGEDRFSRLTHASTLRMDRAIMVGSRELHQYQWVIGWKLLRNWQSSSVLSPCSAMRQLDQGQGHFDQAVHSWQRCPMPRVGMAEKLTMGFLT